MSKMSEAKKRNNKAWDAKNMATIGTRIRKETAEAFRQYAQAQGTTANALLKIYVLQCLGRTEDAQETPDPQHADDCVSECLRLIQRVTEEIPPTE